ncbi:MAG: DNA topoisomerase, partial [Chloroflexota bacterium]
MAKSLVIVESPTKARTLSQILGRGYTVQACLGHVRDLPKSRLGVDVEQGFVPNYLVPAAKKKIIKGLKAESQKATSLILATDPDREGEAIAWHLAEVLGIEPASSQRVVFHEITPEAVKAAFKTPRIIDMKLVEAQQARRILDRLVGYELSPLLWKKLRGRLSAGRVQSAALRIVADREREIDAFVPREFWTIDVELKKSKKPPTPFLARFMGKEIGQESETLALSSAFKHCRYPVDE